MSVTRIFRVEDQMAFARLSGDFNPLHIDALQARRSLAGGVVVHGIHLLLWALDRWCAARATPLLLDRVDVEFLKPLPVGAEVKLDWALETTEMVTFALTAGPTHAATIDVSWRAGTDGRLAALTLPETSQPKDLGAADLPGCSGNLPLSLEPVLTQHLFPYLLDCLPPIQIASLLASTRLVGMECPGLHSIYSELHLQAALGGDGKSLQFRVKHFDARFKRVTMTIEAPGMSGSIHAFLRPTPQLQEGCAAIRDLVAANQFAGQRALIVGGSRGLGEVMAKVLAMGGADVLISYHSGEQDAAQVAADIQAHGGKATCTRFDVTDPAPEAMATLSAWQPTHLYYMATPHISSGQRGLFRNEMFARFCTYYLDGFARLLAGLNSGALRGVFYPSSVMLDELPPEMGEYVAAKSAGEALCATLQKASPGVRFSWPRLPRLATDQTMTLLHGHIRAAPPLLLVLGKLTRFCQETP